MGAGAIGLIACKNCRSGWPLSVSAIEPNERKRKLAHDYGATAVFNPTEPGWKEPVPRKHAPEHVGVDVVLEMSGSAAGNPQRFETGTARR